MAFGATKIIPARLVQGDREKIQRTMKVLEQDIARLEKQLAERRSPEGQEATRATILSKRARVHRLNSYLMRSVPHQVRPRRKPIPTTHQSAEVAPKGSVQNKMRMEQARKALKSPAAKPESLQVNLQKLPKVTDDASAKKYTEVLEANKKTMHEMQMRIESLERHSHVEMRPAVKEVPAAPPLSPSEKQELIELPKQLKHLNDRLAIVKKNVRRANDDGYMRSILSKFKQTRRGGYANLFPQRGLSLKIWMEMKPTPQTTILRKGAGRYRAQRLTHPDLEIIPQRMQSIRNRLDFLNKKKAGVADLKGAHMKPMKHHGFMDRVKAEGVQAAHMEHLGAIQARGLVAGAANPHRPYAMGRNLGMATVMKHRRKQREHRPALESNTMAGLRRYTAAEYARDSRKKAEAEQKKEVANLAGAFSQTRAVMERMVR